MLVERLDQLREVDQRAGQAVDLVDDNDVDVPAVCRRAAAERRALHVPPEKPPSS